MRLFTALDPPSDARDRCAELQNTLSLPTARWTPLSQLHVTVRFVGDTAPEQAQRYEAALSEVQCAPARCAPYGLDVLPSRQTPRVVVVGLTRTDSLLALHESVSTALASEGLAPEERTYRPHLTLARLDDPDPERVHHALRANDAPLPAAFAANTLHLYESTLASDGAVHEKRSSFALSAPAA